MSAEFAPVMAWVPPQTSTHCRFGHRLHARNTAMDMLGQIICLECMAMVGDATSYAMGRLIAIMLDLAPFPTREQVYGQ